MSDNSDHELFEKLTKMTEDGVFTENELLRFGEWKASSYKADYYKKKYEEVHADLGSVVEVIARQCSEFLLSSRRRRRDQDGESRPRIVPSTTAAPAEEASNGEGPQSGPAEKRARSE